MLTTKQKIRIGSFSRSPNPSSPASPPHLVPFYTYIFPDPAEKSGAYQLTLRSRDLTFFLELNGPFNVLTESSIPQSYVNSHSHHFRTAPPTADEFIDDYYSFSALRACAISLGRHDLEELCKLRLDDIMIGKYHSALAKNRIVIPEKVPIQSGFQFHVVNINTPVSTSSLSPRSDNAHSPTHPRTMYQFLPKLAATGANPFQQANQRRAHVTTSAEFGVTLEITRRETKAGADVVTFSNTQEYRIGNLVARSPAPSNRGPGFPEATR